MTPASAMAAPADRAPAWLLAALWLARLVVAGALVTAGVLKAMNPPLFALDIEAFQVVPPRVAVLAAYYMPFLEIAAGLGLLLPWTRRGALLLAGGMLLGFTALLALAWARGLDVQCGCFGAASHGGGGGVAWGILRNLGLLAAAGFLAWRERTP